MDDKVPARGEPVAGTLSRLLLELLDKSGRIELENVSIDIAELEIVLGQGTFLDGPATMDKPWVTRPEALHPYSFQPRHETWPGRVGEVVLGASAAEGGSRRAPVTIGGSAAPALYHADDKPAMPIISLDVFDMKVPMPKALVGHIGDARNDPVEWAKINVEKFGADMVTVHLISTDPLQGDVSPQKAARTVEDVLQAVDVPLVIGGSGDPAKDARVFQKVAESAEGERLLFNSVTLDMSSAGTLGTVASAARDHGHAVLAFTGLDLNSAKELNRRLYSFLPPGDIAMDLTTAALGYGLEYSFTIHERARMAALMGDHELSHPTVSAATNAWAAREAWMDLPPEYGQKEIRGPIWETVTALALVTAGVDLLFMMHPGAVQTVRTVLESRSRAADAKPGEYPDWVSARIP